MNTFSLSNIPLNKFRTFLFNQGCSRVSTEGGHEKWTREGLTRPIIIQTHIDPVSELIVRNTIRALGISRKEFISEMRQI